MENERPREPQKGGRSYSGGTKPPLTAMESRPCLADYTSGSDNDSDNEIGNEG